MCTIDTLFIFFHKETLARHHPRSSVVYRLHLAAVCSDEVGCIFQPLWSRASHLRRSKPVMLSHTKLPSATSIVSPLKPNRTHNCFSFHLSPNFQASWVARPCFFKPNLSCLRLLSCARQISLFTRAESILLVEPWASLHCFFSHLLLELYFVKVLVNSWLGLGIPIKWQILDLK